jgi:hypothetical protein
MIICIATDTSTMSILRLLLDNVRIAVAIVIFTRRTRVATRVVVRLEGSVDLFPGARMIMAESLERILLQDVHATPNVLAFVIHAGRKAACVVVRRGAQGTGAQQVRRIQLQCMGVVSTVIRLARSLRFATQIVVRRIGVEETRVVVHVAVTRGTHQAFACFLREVTRRALPVRRAARVTGLAA